MKLFRQIQGWFQQHFVTTVLCYPDHAIARGTLCAETCQWAFDNYYGAVSWESCTTQVDGSILFVGPTKEASR